MSESSRSTGRLAYTSLIEYEQPHRLAATSVDIQILAVSGQLDFRGYAAADAQALWTALICSGVG